jgi:hypothetical protein
MASETARCEPERGPRAYEPPTVTVLGRLDQLTEMPSSQVP